MKYFELRKLSGAKNISATELCRIAEYTRAGLNRALDNDTIDLRRIKLLCNALKISPALFFDNYKDLSNENLSAEITHLRNENEMLKNQLKDKNEIISLLREKNVENFNAVAENKTKLAEYSKTKK